MEPKKISFGFSKLSKKTNVIPSKAAQKPETKRVELIKCLEGHEIKLVEEKPVETPLFIPLKENQKTSTALASLMKRRAVLLGEDDPIESCAVIENGKDAEAAVNDLDNIEQRAAKELLAGVKANSCEKFTTELILPVVHPDDLLLEGAKESSLDDYDDIPVEQFGKAMLRGMGWVEPAKNAKGSIAQDDSPMVRPKGMGLGADKALKAKPLLVAPETNEVLEIKRNACVRILGGKHKDLYGQIEGFDDHAGRVIVKMAIGGYKEAFNEFLCQPISKKEYAQYGKCINSTKYEEYKRKENEHGVIVLKKNDITDIAKRTIKYEKTKKESRYHSSDDDCQIVEKRPTKYESSSSKLEKRQYDDLNNKREHKRENEEYKKYDHRYKEPIVRREKTREDSKELKRDEYSRVDKHRGYMRNKEHSYMDRTERNADNQTDSHEKCYKEAKHANEDAERRKSISKHRQRDCDDGYNNERRGRHTKPTTSDESDNDRRTFNKSYKDKKTKKKSKNIKKDKTKYQESETESDSSSSSSDTDQDRHRRSNKKTKKRKHQRERSRSRGRR